MGAMHKMGVYLGLVEDDPERYADYDHDQHQPAGRENRNSEPISRHAAVAERRTSASVPAQAGTIDSYRITTLHPRTYNEARTIGEEFRMGVPVIMNLTEMDDTDAKRLVDFSAGLVFGCHGSIERVTQKVFLLSPANVDVTPEDKARIARGGFFNQS
jgi:cell division inhibitor SepF